MGLSQFLNFFYSYRSFGVVVDAICIQTGERVAIKKVLQDPKYKNRELDILKLLRHQNVVMLKDYFYTDEQTPSSQTMDKYLNVVMDYVPHNLYTVMKNCYRTPGAVPEVAIKLFAYQILRSLGYLHSIGICHRDIKPQNLLVDPETGLLKLCDFGSAKALRPDETSVSYICSRYYRAPELMLGAEKYTNAIDIWSIGCVVAELYLTKPLFPGESSVDQLVKIIQTMGTPTSEEMYAMNPNASNFAFPPVRPKSWRAVIESASPEALDLLSKLLVYAPHKRLSCYAALSHPYFDEIRDMTTFTPLPFCANHSERPQPPLYNFTNEELRNIEAAGGNIDIVFPARYRRTVQQ